MYGKFHSFNNGFNRIIDGYLQGDELRQSARDRVFNYVHFLTKKR